MFTRRELTDVFEEDFDDPDSLAGSGGVPDPLLAELGRARTGQMRDIVATIQAEQDAIIRAPLETCLVVQGGPGYRQDRGRAAPRRVPALRAPRRCWRAKACSSSGPNPVFLRYISQVLPSLGETSATQTTVDGLLALRFRVVADDPLAVAAVKGDARMAEVIERGGGRRDPDSRRRTCTLRFRTRRLDVHAPTSSTRSSPTRAAARAPFATQRERFRQSLCGARTTATPAASRSSSTKTDFGAELLADARVAQGDRRLLAAA